MWKSWASFELEKVLIVKTLALDILGQGFLQLNCLISNNNIAKELNLNLCKTLIENGLVPPLCWEQEAGLIERAYTNDFWAVELLYEKYSRRAFGLALGILNDHHAAEDAVQDAFLKFSKNPNNYDPNRGSFINWLLTVVRNSCLDYLRKPSSCLTLSLDQLSQNESDTKDGVSYQYFHSVPLLEPQFLFAQNRLVEDEIWQKLQQEILQRALATLPVKQRMLIEIAFFKGLTHQQIAIQTGLPLGTVKSSIRLGLLKLRGISEVSALALTSFENGVI